MKVKKIMGWINMNKIVILALVLLLVNGCIGESIDSDGGEEPEGESEEGIMGEIDDSLVSDEDDVEIGDMI